MVAQTQKQFIMKSITVNINLTHWELIPYRVYHWDNGTNRSSRNPCYKFLCFTLAWLKYD